MIFLNVITLVFVSIEFSSRVASKPLNPLASKLHRVSEKVSNISTPLPLTLYTKPLFLTL